MNWKGNMHTCTCTYPNHLTLSMHSEWNGDKNYSQVE